MLLCGQVGERVAVGPERIVLEKRLPRLPLGGGRSAMVIMARSMVVFGASGPMKASHSS